MASAAQSTLLRDVIEFVLSSELFAVMETHLRAVDDVSCVGAAMNGYSLESGERHRRMIDEFERRLQTFIERRGSSCDAFYKLLQRAAAYTPAVSALVALLDIVTDFTVFVEMSNDTTKREYVRATMNNYRRMIQAQSSNTVRI